jgi:hypothetical protein
MRGVRFEFGTIFMSTGPVEGEDNPRRCVPWLSCVVATRAVDASKYVRTFAE